MIREKYESLPLATLKELAKARKMKGVSTLKKADLIEAMISLDEQEDQEKLSEQKESSQEHLKEMQNQNREEKAASELKENKEHREAKDKKPGQADSHARSRPYSAKEQSGGIAFGTSPDRTDGICSWQEVHVKAQRALRVPSHCHAPRTLSRHSPPSS